MMLIKRVIDKLAYMLQKKIKPQIIGGFKNANGQYFSNTRVSNLTHISNHANNLFIGENVFIGHFNYIDGFNAKVTISNNVQITNYVNILTHSSHHSIRLFASNFGLNYRYPDILQFGEIFIGENSYIGPHSVITPGSKIGKGSIVSAYSFVKGEFPDFAIIRGQPAKIVGDTREIDKKLLAKYPELIETYYLKDEIN